MIDQSQLREPVTHEDAQDHEEYLEAAAETVKALFDRTRFQYQGDTPVSNELWQIYCLVHHAYERMSNLRAAGCFPPAS